jgi:hypothetical protein
MTIRIKRIGLWRTEVPGRPGALAEVLEPLAHGNADLKVVRVHAAPSGAGRLAVEVYAGEGKRAAGVARAAGFSLEPSTTVLLQGDNRPGLAFAVADAIAWAGIGVRDLDAEVVGTRYSAILTFGNETDAEKAVAVIRKVTRAGAARNDAAR